MAIKSYQRRLGVGFADTAAVRARLQFEARQGWLRANVLYLDEKPCAFWIGSVHGGVYFSNYLGFDADYASFAPGMFLILKVMQDLSDGGQGSPVHVVDFGGGAAEYKQRLATRNWREVQLYIFAPHVKAIGVNMARLASVGISRLSETVVGAAGVKDKVKKAMRKLGS